MNIQKVEQNKEETANYGCKESAVKYIFLSLLLRLGWAIVTLFDPHNSPDIVVMAIVVEKWSL